MEMLSLHPRCAPPRRGMLAWYRAWTNFTDHKWMYDGEGLASLFREAGFVDPEPRGYLESVIPACELELVEDASRILDGGGVCVEARK